MSAPHKWITSRVGHGVMQCEYCAITMLEAASLGHAVANHCDKAASMLQEKQNYKDGEKDWEVL